MDNNATATHTLPITEWRWFHIYHWILALHHGRFVKYNSTLHQTLHAHDLIGAQLFTLTRSDWLTLGVSDLGDIQILLDEVARLKGVNVGIEPEVAEVAEVVEDGVSESEDSDDVDAADTADTADAASPTLNSLLYHNHLRQTALSNQCRNLYVYAVSLAQQLSAERAHRLMAEQALAEQAVQTQALREALSRCQSSATSVQTTMTAMATRTCELEGELEARDEELSALNTAFMALRAELNAELSERSEELSAAKASLAAMETTTMKSVRWWSVDECYLWMARIDGGRFGRAYVDLYERLEVENLNGAMLERMGVEDMERVGIEDGCDQRRLLAEIRVLLQTQAQRGREVEEAIEFEEDEYDFADLELLSSSWGTD